MFVHLCDDPNAELRRELHDSLDREISISLGHNLPETIDVVVGGRPTSELLDAHPEIRAVVVPFAGVPEATLSIVSERPHISLYNLHHNAASTAEHALALMMAVGRRILTNDTALRQNQWGGRTIPNSIGTKTAAHSFEGSTCLLIGYGAIGTRIARYCFALGMSIDVVRVSNSAESHGELRFHTPEQLSKLIPGADVVVLAAPLTPQTIGMIGADSIALMKSNAIVVNIARGALIDEEALYMALRDRRIGGAGLDVWWQYPTNEKPVVPPSQFDFASLDNVVMTPHIGGANKRTEFLRYVALANLLNEIRAGTARKVDMHLGY